MGDLIDRVEAIRAIRDYADKHASKSYYKGMNRACKVLLTVPSVESDNKLRKIADLVDGTIDHFDLDDAMDLLYQIKDVLRSDN